MIEFLRYHVYPCAVIAAWAWVFYSKWQFSDDRGESQGKWHSYGAIARAMPFVMILCQYFWPAAWQDILLSACIFINLFEIGINKFALVNVSILYNGSNSKFDSLKKYKWVICFGLLATGIALKIFIQ